MAPAIDKARFAAPLRVERLVDGTWRLLRPLIFESPKLGMVVHVPRGFITDFASVPRVPFAYMLFAGVADEAAVVHDFAYSAGILTRSQADDLFAEAMIACGVPAWRRGPIWAAVRLFGGARYVEPVKL